MLLNLIKLVIGFVLIKYLNHGYFVVAYSKKISIMILKRWYL